MTDSTRTPDHAALWSALAAGDPAAREALLIEHLNLVHHVARQLARTLSARPELDELVSAGTIGLMEALTGFDPDRGLAFGPFAGPRIRGAILDELRRQDHVPRSVRRKTREIAAAREALTRVLGRLPEDREIAEHMKVDLETLWRWKADLEGAVHVPLDRSAGDRDGYSHAPAELLSGDQEDAIEEKLTLTQEVEFLRDAIFRLKEQERTVLTLYYFEELKLHEIATILELTESRVSQIRSKALANLRTELAPLREAVA